MANEEREVHHPNRELPESKQTRATVVLILLASVAVMAVVTVAGWNEQAGAGFIQIAYIVLYILFAVLVFGWNRGTLAIAMSLAMILIIFAAVAAPDWFSRDKSGFDEPLLPASLLGILTLIIIPLQVLLIGFALRGFKQQWNVEA